MTDSENRLACSPQPICKTDVYNTKRWYLNGLLHMENAPAVEYVSGTKEWWLYGLPHREGGPAFESYNGTKEWRIRGELHRLDGPAVEYEGGGKEWWVNGTELYSEDDMIKFKQLSLLKEK